MKKHLTILLLFVSVCFYGQELVELHGLYAPAEKGHYMYGITEGYQELITLSFENEADIPQGVTDMCSITVRGRKGNSQNSFIVEKVISLSWNNIFQKENINEFVEIEGFYTSNDEYTFLMEKKGNHISDTSILEIPEELKDTIRTIKDDALIRVKAIKKQGKPTKDFGYFKTSYLITQIITIENDYLLCDFKDEETTEYLTNKIKDLQLEEIEGIYSQDFENNRFLEIKNGKLQKSIGVLEFEIPLTKIDSLKNITDYKSSEFKEGIYIKLKGYKVQKGSNYFSYLIVVNQILVTDFKRTLKDYIKK